jgi:hypothetical protein
VEIYFKELACVIVDPGKSEISRASSRLETHVGIDALQSGERISSFLGNIGFFSLGL